MLAVCLAMLDDPTEKEQFTAIYNRYKRLVYHTAHGVLHDAQLAEDILQEVFLYLAKNFTQIPTENCHKLARYLVIVSRTRAINLLKQRAHETTPEDFAPETQADPAPPPADAMVDLERAARLMALVANLKEIYRAPLELLAQGATYAQIAAALNLPEATVRKRVERGRALLWRELRKDEE